MNLEYTIDLNSAHYFIHSDATHSTRELSHSLQRRSTWTTESAAGFYDLDIHIVAMAGGVHSQTTAYQRPNAARKFK